MVKPDVKAWLNDVLKAWEDFRELEKTFVDPDGLVDRICKLYTKRDLARALLILQPLTEPRRKRRKE